MAGNWGAGQGCSPVRFDGPESFDCGSFRIIYLTLNAAFFREFSGIQDFLSNLLL